MNTPQTILAQYWGYASFRPMQEEIIRAVLDNQDTLALLPTGGGKSLCYQVPTLCYETGMCLVISPLIALMKDQVEQLNKRGIMASSITSGMPYQEVKQTLENALHGNIRFLYVSPERLETNLFLEYANALPIILLAVDEAHCVSQWGYDFRPPYLRIASIREQLSPETPLIALTASATKEVQQDICEKLLFKQKRQQFQQSFERPNLSYQVHQESDKKSRLIDTLKKSTGSAIVYCKSRRQTKEIADLLNLQHISANHYHAGLPQTERDQKQTDWINNSFRVMAATNAFGMGIDKPDVRMVVHLGIPDCLENYYQEAGRAGRDGGSARAIMFHNSQDEEDLLHSTDVRFPEKKVIQRVYHAVMNFLQIPGGYGAGNSYEFDLKTCCERFHLDAVSTSHVIKLLEQENLISYNESFFQASTIEFICDKPTLQDIEISHPELDNTVKSLLRLYEGIFDMPVHIHEKKIASFARLSIEKTIHQLKQMARMGIIRYKPQKETPQIFLIQNRMYEDNFHIDLTGFLKRKAQYEHRVKNMLSFIKTDGCRSVFIGNYFGDEQLNSCGVCDNCHEQIARPSEKINQAVLLEKLLKFIEDNAVTLTDVVEKFDDIPKETLLKCIEYLLTENEIALDEGGFFKKTG